MRLTRSQAPLSALCQHSASRTDGERLLCLECARTLVGHREEQIGILFEARGARAPTRKISAKRSAVVHSACHVNTIHRLPTMRKYLPRLAIGCTLFT